MNSSDLEQIRIRFDAGEQRNPLHWVQLGQETIEEAVTDLQCDGIAISSEQASSEQDSSTSSVASTGAKGFGVDDFLISIATSIAANVVSDLLFRTVTNIFQRMHRPKSITLEAGGDKIQFDCDETPQAIRTRISSWFSRSLSARKDITILADD